MILKNRRKGSYRRVRFEVGIRRGFSVLRRSYVVQTNLNKVHESVSVRNETKACI